MVKSSIFFTRIMDLPLWKISIFWAFLKLLFSVLKCILFYPKCIKKTVFSDFFCFCFLNGLTHIVFNYFHFDGCPFSLDLGYKSKTRNRIKLNVNEDKILCNNHCSILCFFRVRMETTKATCFCIAVFYVLTFGMWSAQATSEGANSLFLFSSTINY